MSTDPSPSQPNAAESIFSAWLSDRSRDFESVVRANAAHAAELRSLHAIWLRLEPMLVRAGIHPSDAVERLTTTVADGADNVTPLDLGSQSGSSSNTTELLRRLEQKRRAARYRFDGEVARGGMGAILRVWDEDIRRHLAMKVVLGQASGSKESKAVDSRLVARFLEEAQVTGQLEHPGIVPVHELGLDAEGRVFFTMKLVKGRDLDAIYELARDGRDGWSETRALGVLLKVCEAVAFAHAKDVIHRDLKPANVMVGDFGEVYVMDWGLARVLGRADAEDPVKREPSVRTERVEERELTPISSMMTMDGDVVGTPSYMPPEQARGEIDSLSARSDVYALGAMLYQLLAGARPYIMPGEKVSGAEVWRRVLAGPPASLDTFASRAPVELVAICEKAMARDPADRYADMLALADDLRAFLEGRVVGAFEGGALAEARKWVRRNKALAASLAVAVLALVAGLVTSLVLADHVRKNALLAENRRVEAERNADEAKRSADDARRSADDARRQVRVTGEVNRFLNEDLLAAVAPDQLGIDVTVREVLDQAAQRLEGRFADEPSVESALRFTIGASYARLGEFTAARPHLERALELRRANEGSDSEAAIRVMIEVADVWSDLGRRAESIELYRDTIARAERSLGLEHEATLVAKNGLAVVLLHDGQLVAAREIYAALLPVQERVLGRDHFNTLATENNLALLEKQEGHYEEAARRLRDVLERLRAAFGSKHPEVLNTSTNLALSLLDLGKARECEELCRETLPLLIEVKGPDHPSTGRIKNFLAMALFRTGRAAEAEPLFADALRIDIAAYGEEHGTTQQTRANLATALALLGRRAEAARMLREALEIQLRVLPADHPTTLETKQALGLVLLGMQQYAESEALLRETLAARGRVLGEDHPNTIMAKENLSYALFQQQSYAESAELLRQVLAARKRSLGDQHPDVAKTTYNLGIQMQASRNLGEARSFLEDAIARLRKLGVNAEPGILTAALQALAELQTDAEEYEAALDSYRGALAEERRVRGEDNQTSAYLLQQVGGTLNSLKEYPAAIEALEEALSLGERFYGADAQGMRRTLSWLATAYLELGVYADAERVLLDLQGRSLRVLGPEHGETQRARAALVDLYERWGKPDEAAKWR